MPKTVTWILDRLKSLAHFVTASNEIDLNSGSVKFIHANCLSRTKRMETMMSLRVDLPPITLMAHPLYSDPDKRFNMCT